MAMVSSQEMTVYQATGRRGAYEEKGKQYKGNWKSKW